MARSFSIDRIRNLGIVAHVDAGKTTLTERILFYTGRVRGMGEVHDGSTVTDHLPQERKKGITITLAAVSCEWRGHRLQLVDTPGHVDFTVEVERSLRVLDGAVLLLDAVAGVEAQTETVWRQAARHGVPVICFVNKMDRPGADWLACLSGLESRLGARPVAISWPILASDLRGPSDAASAEPELVGAVDLVRMQALVWPAAGDGSTFEARPVPEPLRAEAASARERLLEACADVDDVFAERWLAGGAIGDAEVIRALRAGTARRAIVPVLCGSAYRNRGVQPLLDAVVDLLPSPADRAPVRSLRGAEIRAPRASEPLAALCFKVVHDDFGPLGFVRVYSGVLRKGAVVQSSRTGDRVRVGRLARVFAAAREDIAEASAGEIAAVTGIALRTGETLSDPEHPVVLEPIEAPRPVVRVAVEPRSRSDHDRMPGALARLLAEDPSLELHPDAETGQMLLGGMGLLHLEVSIDRLRTEHRVEVVAGRPLVAYRERLGRTVEHEVEHAKQSGGPGQYARLRARLGPGPAGCGVAFADETRGGAVPARFHAAIVKGVARAMTEGPLGGYPVVDVALALLDGAVHSHDSSELAFEIAGARFFREAAPRAAPVLLEPVMRLEVSTPAASLGDVLGDLASRRARVLSVDDRSATARGTETRADERAVHALVPLAETFGYAGALAGVTRGRGGHTLELASYEPVPIALARLAR